MRRKQTDTAHINLRIREALRRKLEIEAKRHTFSLNNEIRWRLEASFEAKAHSDIWKTAEFIQSAWLKFSATQKLLDQGEAMAEAIMQGASIDQVKTLARQWQATQQTLKRPVLLEESPFLEANPPLEGRKS